MRSRSNRSQHLAWCDISGRSLLEGRQCQWRLEGKERSPGAPKPHPNPLHAIVAIGLLFFSSVLSRAQETNESRRPDLQSFRIITQRNIFNASRSPRRERTRSESEPERRTRTDSVALLGTMSYEKGWVAFFGGSSPEYRKALHPGDTIADHKIAEIAVNYVKLESGTNQPIDLRVGSEMKKQDEGAWEVRDRIETSIAATTSPSPSTDTNASTGGNGESDIIKRLMQQREQELQK